MRKHPEITRDRLCAFVQLSDWQDILYPERHRLDGLEVYSPAGRIRFDEAVEGPYRATHVGASFGPLWGTHWFRLTFQVPAAWQDRELHLLWDASAEACVWQEGEPLQGLTGCRRHGEQVPIRAEFPLTGRVRAGEHCTLYVEVACNGLFGKDVFEDERLLRRAELAVFDPDARDLLWDLTVVAEMAMHLPPDTPRAGQALWTGNRMVNLCNPRDPATWPAVRAEAETFLRAGNGDGQHEVSAIGHAHIDTAWLWPLAETRRKCVRTFSSVMRLMEEDPEFLFACSQAVQLDWIKSSHPGLYGEIKTRAGEGRFVPVGGTWVEPDCNVPSGESLVRQFLYGQRFFRSEFGRHCTEFWNPDVFGYSGQLPQIMQGAGITRFLTQKLSWNQFNKPRHHTFWWEGIDGSRVLTHFPPSDTYNGTAEVAELLGSVARFKDHDRARESIYLFGYGDGGGGPTREMLERLKRMKDVDGLPRVTMRHPEEFFDRCEADIRDPSVWVGELYFELHRGTYTTQAAVKQGNRHAESLLHDLEFLYTLPASGHEYPARELERLWKQVLLNQFHDILPGSSIQEVYVDARAQYEEVLEEGGRLRDRVLDALATVADPVASAPTRIFAANTLCFAREEVADLPGRPGELGVVRVPAMGWAVADPVADSEPGVALEETDAGFVLENRWIKALIGRDGHLLSLFEKQAQREAIMPEERGNHLVMFDDRPLKWDAWDVDIYHLEKRREIAGADTVRVTEQHPLRVSLEAEYTLSPTSSMRQTIHLDARSRCLVFSCEVDWQEQEQFLKVEFPLQVRAMDAAYEIQFGHLKRPTHTNTTWDLARFEVCAQHWADLAEPGFGVALLNDGKYGYAVQGSTMRLSLLRSPQYPDPRADIGRHAFRYALYPHPGSLQEADVVQEGQAFNSPIHLRTTTAPCGSTSFFELCGAGVFIDTVKKAEDAEALILRLYEAHGNRGPVRIRSALPVRTAARCNLLEEEDTPLSWEDGETCLAVRPFEIITLKLVLDA